ncbi:hypothetical protein KKA00_06765 [bacterium]|nr:hypothetical protein [bacterium]MBU1651904.1 hypothetical protein [bacterium]
MIEVATAVIELATVIVPCINIARRTITKKNQGITELTDVREFWEKRRSNFICEGMIIEINGTVSKYAPMITGDPIMKRRNHLEYRKELQKSTDKYKKDENNINTTLSFSSGNTIWKLYEHDGLVFMGIYQSIVRNSIPLFVEKEYYDNQLLAVFNRFNQTSFCEARIKAKVLPMPKPFSDQAALKLNRFICPDLALYVGEKGTSIKLLGETRFLDGDIWVGIEKQGEQFLLSRFLNLADESELRSEVEELRTDIEMNYPDSATVTQFDQVNRYFGPGIACEDRIVNIWDKL